MVNTLASSGKVLFYLCVMKFYGIIFFCILSGVDSSQSATAIGETTSGSAKEREILNFGMLYTEYQTLCTYHYRYLQ